MLNEQMVRVAARVLLGRPPKDAAELQQFRSHPTLRALRSSLLRSAEAAELLAEVGALRPSSEFRAPLFLLEPPEGLPWRLEPPSLDDPVTQLATYGQTTSAAYARWCAALDAKPAPHRKQWEFAWILATLDKGGLLRPGARVLGFGVGREKLPAFFAGRGMSVVATDAPVELVEGSWARGNQHAAALADLRRPELVAEAEFDRLVTFRPADMNAIPEDLRGFDACWSACALEHLGSLAHGLAFIENSLACLRPGGLALHTTEFNLASNEATLDRPGTSLYRKRDIEGLLRRLAAAGHEVWPVNFHPGGSAFDQVVDVPPYSSPHLKVAVRNYVTTSIGIAVRKAE